MDSEFLLFADDSKLLRRVSNDGHLLLNADLQRIVALSNACGMPLSVPKCCVLHYNGRYAVNRGANYLVEGIQIASQCECADLGVTRQTDGLFKQHIANTAAKAARHVDLSLRSFVCRNKEFMLRLFTSYIRPILEYAAPVWSPLDVASTTRLELVQRRFTKCIVGYYHLSYQERLARLQLPSLKLRRDLLTACLIYKILHNHVDITPQSVGLHLSCNNTRSGGIKLHVPRPFCSAFKCSFMFRVASLWNSIPYAVLQAPSLLSFKMQLLRYWRLEGGLVGLSYSPVRFPFNILYAFSFYCCLFGNKEIYYYYYNEFKNPTNYALNNV